MHTSMGKDMKSGLHAFRVAVPRREIGGVPTAAGKEHHTRRAHNKSRGGCEGCKQRRKKERPLEHVQVEQD
jgi:hypothetical protein